MWVKLGNNEGTQVRKCKVDHERLYRSAVADMTTEPLFFTPRRALQSNAGTQRTEKSPLFSGVCRPLNPNRCKIFFCERTAAWQTLFLFLSKSFQVYLAKRRLHCFY